MSALGRFRTFTNVRLRPEADVQTNPPLVVIMLNGCKGLVDKLEQIEVPMVDDGKEADAYLIHE